MARPIKSGLDYFPLDTDFFNDDKIEFVSARFEEKGELIAIKLLCKIYKSGYCITWNDDTALLFAKSAGKNITPGLAKDVVDELLKRGFFDRNLYMRCKILSSNGIQKRYELICKGAKRKSLIEDEHRLDLVSSEKQGVIPEENPLNSGVNTTKEIKGNKSKIKESKETAVFDFLEKDYEECFLKWLNYKKERRESYKSRESTELCYKGLKEKAKNNPELAKLIVKRSMENNWAGLFEMPEKELKKINSVNAKTVNQHATAEEYLRLDR